MHVGESPLEDEVKTDEALFEETQFGFVWDVAARLGAAAVDVTGAMSERFKNL